MKFRLCALFLFLTLTASFTATYQDGCEPLFPISKGSTWKYNEYDKKGKLSGTSTTIVEDITSSGSKVDYTMKGVHDGPKGKEKNHFEKTFHYICEDGVFKMSMENMIPQETMEGLDENVEIEVDQTEMTFPSTLSVGEKLEDAAIKMSVSMNGFSVMNINVNITNRKVEKQEDITTEAGTFPCYLVTYDVNTKLAFAKTEGSSKDWYSTNVGIVKSESYDKKGELTSSRELTEYISGK